MVEKVVVTFALAAVAVLLSPRAADAQRASTAKRIGYLSPISRPETHEAFRQELHRHGYVEGKNILLEYRSAQGDFERLPELAAELVTLKVDVIVAERTQAALAAKKGDRDNSNRDGGCWRSFGGGVDWQPVASRR